MQRNKDSDDVGQDPAHIDPPPKGPSDSSSDGGDGWSFGGGLIKTFVTQSELMLETYRWDLREFGSGFKEESEVLNGVLKSTTDIVSQGKESLISSLDGEFETPETNKSLSSSWMVVWWC
ncbi:Hypothetical predicted protein [Olea europaea subsp. europaea]|uniref:Uncharacterized protein n=1 Tax=Olea europaea subsp. europaea TaxID=158383 RepID=A0A8S0S7T0_OLEEU|nr:Hypothetical predicted protein [Olea europaea subsp. europaea]